MHALEPLSADEITRALTILGDDAGPLIARVVLDEPTDTGSARPIEGVVAFVDAGRAEVLEVQDHGVVPIPVDKGSYLPADNEPLRADLKPIEITQPEGPSFTLDGHHLTWQRWSLRLSMDPY